MIEIHIEPNDKADIIELLEYALEKKIEEDKSNSKVWQDSGYWKVRVPQLEQLIGGTNPHDLIQRSTCGYVVKKSGTRGRR